MKPFPVDFINKNLTKAAFESLALRIFRYQYQNNPVYRQYCDGLKVNPREVERPEQIPFLPVEFFKTHLVTSAPPPYDTVFLSSGTTGMARSKHYVKDLKIYEQSFLETFRMFYGEPENYVMLGLLPSYLEQGHSSLIYMVKKLMDYSGHPANDFYMHNHRQLARTLETLEQKGRKTLLIGVSYALLDFFEKFPIQLSHTLVVETGGMKGRRREMIREELHERLKKYTGLPRIHSEYGMTELLSQAYSQGQGIFQTPPWMKILTRDPEDPLSYVPAGKTGGINIIDLANIHSCSFLMTQDLGKLLDGDKFEVLGRFDNSDVRGCNLMAAE